MLIGKIDKFKAEFKDKEGMYTSIKKVDPGVSATPFGQEIEKLISEKDKIINKIDE